MIAYGHSILIVDDDKELSLILEYALIDRGLTVITADNGAEALEYLRNWAFDVVVLDLGLPDMDGKTLLRKMKREKPKVKVIIMTGYDDVESYIDTTQHGAFDYLIKPSSPKELMLVIEKALQI